MAYSTLATQADTPTAGPDHTYFEAIAANETALLLATGAKISSVTPQTVAGGVTQKLTLGTVVFDALGGSFTGTANRITIPTNYGGVYLVNGSLNVTCATNSGGQSILAKVRKNNTTDVYECVDFSTGATTVVASVTQPFTVQLVATDFLEIYIVNAAGGNTATCREDLGLSLSAVWLSP